MASSLALKKLLFSSALFHKALRPARPLTHSVSSSRLFNTDAARYSDDEDDERGLVSDPRSSGRRVRTMPAMQWYGPFSTRNVSELLNTMDRLMESPVASGIRQLPWDVKETKDALHLRVDMPGLGKEDVKVSMEQNMLVIKGEGKKEFDGDEVEGRKMSSRVVLPENVYKTSDIKAEMKNGVLKVVLPKMKEEERIDVINIKVE